ncbi:hypothetical protein GCM10023191_101810 [Actinoallomurus oryzae]|uniref:ParB-like N-terminal domain-containing protein n=1 Tax=Actinoallomurus oryzae TaxID=502180 RepID=A0ABP8R9S6_9ACTN
MGQRVRLSSLATAPVEDVPGGGTEVAKLRPAQIAATPLNPRENFGDADELAELGESMRVRQLQPVVVVSRAAYLKLWPEHADHVGSAEYVLANGERRYRSALHVDLKALEAVIRDEVAESRAAFLDALLSENIDRKNFDPVEEALAVEAMVQECGSAKVAAERFRRHESWVSQRRALLKLAPAIQARVRAGDVPVRVARSIASLPPEEQEAALAEASKPSPRPRQPPSSERVEGGNRGRDDADGTGVFTAVKRNGGGVPWESPEAVADLIRRHLTPEDIKALVALLGAPE